MNAPFDHGVLDRLGAAGLLADQDRLALRDVAARYAVAVPAALMERAKTSPAIARQFVPDRAELTLAQDESTDPIRSEEHTSELQSH